MSPGWLFVVAVDEAHKREACDDRQTEAEKRHGEETDQIHDLHFGELCHEDVVSNTRIEERGRG
jgi:hypothetical protein